MRKGFQRPQGTGVRLRDLQHPTLQIGLEVVSGPLFDGLVPQDRLIMVTFDQGPLIVISVEDAIADRLGQYASHEPSGATMLNQAVQLFRLASEIDETYLEKRIRQETTQTYGLGFLKDQVESYENSLVPTSRR